MMPPGGKGGGKSPGAHLPAPNAAGYGGGCGGLGNPHAVYFGHIKSFRDDKGWGHISCPQTQAIYGKDMFVLRSALNGNVVREGEAVQFSVTLGLKGPEATNVRSMGHVDEHQIYAGSVKLFNREKGWGFVTCDETQRLFNKDIFIHKKDLGGHIPTEGESVSFQVIISESGRPEGTSLSFAGAGGSYAAWKGDVGEGFGEEEAWSGGQILPTGHGPGPTRLGKGKGARPGPYV